MPSPANITAFPTPAPALEAATARRSAGDEARRSFLRIVSHELRTPLNSIIGFSEILNQELCGPIGSPQYKDYAGLIGQSGHRLLKLVNQILDIVRLEDKSAELNLGPEALEPLVEDAFNQVREEAQSRGVALHLEDARALPDVTADPRAMQTVLINLLQNAIAFAPEASPVSVRGRLIAGTVVVEIEDRGPGVAPEDLDRILRPFEQGGQALTRQGQGAGLGLPITRLLCQAMGGELELRSVPGAGFTAVVTLPAA